MMKCPSRVALLRVALALAYLSCRASAARRRIFAVRAKGTSYQLDPPLSDAKKITVSKSGVLAIACFCLHLTPAAFCHLYSTLRTVRLRAPSASGNPELKNRISRNRRTTPTPPVACIDADRPASSPCGQRPRLVDSAQQPRCGQRASELLALHADSLSPRAAVSHLDQYVCDRRLAPRCTVLRNCIRGEHSMPHRPKTCSKHHRTLPRPRLDPCGASIHFLVAI